MKELFPVLQVEPAFSAALILQQSELQILPPLTLPVNMTVKKIYLVGECMMDINEGHEMLPFLTDCINETLERFPAARTLHLPSPDALEKTVEDDEDVLVGYLAAIKHFRENSDARIRSLQLIMDQDVWPSTTDLHRLRMIEE